MKAKWAVLVTDLLSEEGVEASGGVSTGVGAGKRGVTRLGTLLTVRNESMRRTVYKLVVFKGVQTSR